MMSRGDAIEPYCLITAQKPTRNGIDINLPDNISSLFLLFNKLQILFRFHNPTVQLFLDYNEICSVQLGGQMPWRYPWQLNK